MVLAGKNHCIPSFPKNDHCSPLLQALMLWLIHYKSIRLQNPYLLRCCVWPFSGPRTICRQTCVSWCRASRGIELGILWNLILARRPNRSLASPIWAMMVSTTPEFLLLLLLPLSLQRWVGFPRSQLTILWPFLYKSLRQSELNKQVVFPRFKKSWLNQLFLKLGENRINMKIRL